MGRQLEKPVFLILLAGITLLFLYLLKPLFGPILWACTLAVVFSPLQARFLKLTRNRKNLAAAVTMLVAVALCVVPLGFVARSLYCEGAALVDAARGQTLDLNRYVDAVRKAVPAVNEWLTRANFDPASVNKWASDAVAMAAKFLSGKAVGIVSGTIQAIVAVCILLYVLFFMLRDGSRLVEILNRALPISEERKNVLFSRFSTVMRAMIKGTLVVALVQGTLGGLIFLILGLPAPVLSGALMGLLSMVPVVGTGLVWGPAAIYLLVTGRIVRGLILIVYGVVFIGLSDNLIRPLLVGRDTRMPDYLVLLSTIGGIAVFGPNGLIIGPLVAALFIAFWNIFAKDYVAKPDEAEGGDE